MAGLRTRKSGAKRFIEFKLCVPGEQSVSAAHALCDRLEELLAAAMTRAVVTIHVEPAGAGHVEPAAAGRVETASTPSR
jgi:divalent metal cation (Fe/Co/Zn/Cd) transporter